MSIETKYRVLMAEFSIKPNYTREFNGERIRFPIEITQCKGVEEYSGDCLPFDLERILLDEEPGFYIDEISLSSLGFLFTLCRETDNPKKYDDSYNVWPEGDSLVFEIEIQRADGTKPDKYRLDYVPGEDDPDVLYPRVRYYHEQKQYMIEFEKDGYASVELSL